MPLRAHYKRAGPEPGNRQAQQALSLLLLVIVVDSAPTGGYITGSVTNQRRRDAEKRNTVTKRRLRSYGFLRRDMSNSLLSREGLPIRRTSHHDSGKLS